MPSPKSPRWRVSSATQRAVLDASGRVCPRAGDVDSEPSFVSPGDPLAALLDGTSGSTLSTKGFQGRARLQADLAQQTGNFFKMVYAAATRKMEPALVNPSLAQAAKQPHHGSLPHKVWRVREKRDLSLLQWQIAKAMDQFANGSPEEAMDIVAMLAVMIEQTALDQGKMDLGFIFSLQQEIFQNHAALPSAALRPFAPLAGPFWIAIALAVKEMDTLAAKRLELSNPKTPSCDPLPPGSKHGSYGVGDMYHERPQFPCGAEAKTFGPGPQVCHQGFLSSTFKVRLAWVPKRPHPQLFLCLLFQSLVALMLTSQSFPPGAPPPPHSVMRSWRGFFMSR